MLAEGEGLLVEAGPEPAEGGAVADPEDQLDPPHQALHVPVVGGAVVVHDGVVLWGGGRGLTWYQTDIYITFYCTVFRFATTTTKTIQKDITTQFLALVYFHDTNPSTVVIC